MSADIPTVEPATLVVGDTWTWKKTLGDYPAGTWTLRYYLRGPTGEITVTATAYGTDHLVSVAASTTAGYQPGRYSWSAVVTSGSERYSVGAGSFVVHPDPAKTGKGFDSRSHARKVLEAIQAMLERKATKDQKQYTIGGRSLESHSWSELLEARDRYRGEVFAEDQAEAAAKGRSVGRVTVTL